MKFLFVLSLFAFVLVGCTSFTTSELVITLNPAVDTIEINTAHVDAKAKAKYGIFSVSITVVENTVNPTKLGTYTITYEAQYQEKVVQITRYVTIVDNTPPEISLNPGVDTIFLGEVWVDAGVTTSDNSKTAPTLTKTGTVNTNVLGSYAIHYESTDESGNTASITRIVHVLEGE